MKIMKGTVRGRDRILILASVFLMLISVSSAFSRTFKVSNNLSYMPNEVVIFVRASATENDVVNLCNQVGATNHFKSKVPNAYILELSDIPGKVPVDEKIDAIKKSSIVSFAERNNVVKLMDVPNDSLYPLQLDVTGNNFLSGQWALQQSLANGSVQNHIFANQAWDIEKGQNSVVVAVLDTGVRTVPEFNNKGNIIRYPHPDLGDYKRIVSEGTSFTINYVPDETADGVSKSRLLNGFSVTDLVDKRPDDAPSDQKADLGWSSHATHVTGIIAAKTNNVDGVAGTCWNGVWVLPIRVFPDGSNGATTDDLVADGILAASTYRNQYAVSGKTLTVNVINLSLGAQSPSTLEQTAIRQAVNMGIVVCAAAGNNWDIGPYPPVYPGAFDECISVGATDFYDIITPFSQHGHAVDIVAPGNEILSTYWEWTDTAGMDDWWKNYQPADQSNLVTYNQFDVFGNGYAYDTGTSMATPFVSAAAALVMSRNAKGQDVRDILTSTATPIGLGHPNDTYGWGEVNLFGAVKKASIQTTIISPSNGGTVYSSKPTFRIDLRNAKPSTIKVWIVPATQNIDTNSTPFLSGTDSSFSKYYTVIDAAAGKATLQFDDILSAGSYKVAVTAESNLNFEVPPAVPYTDYSEVRFIVSPSSLSPGWHLFAMPLYTSTSVTPSTIFSGSGVLARWNYARGRTGGYAMYSFDGSRSDAEASLRPPSVVDPSDNMTEKLVHPLDPSAESPSIDSYVATPPGGLGYWLFLSSSQPLPEISGTSLVGPYEIGLYRGWNMVGNPFPFTIDWSTVQVEYAGNRVPITDAVSNGWISSFLFRYDTINRKYIWDKIGSAAFPAWESEWIQVKATGPYGWPQQDIKLIVPPNPYTGGTN